VNDNGWKATVDAEVQANWPRPLLSPLMLIFGILALFGFIGAQRAGKAWKEVAQPERAAARSLEDEVLDAAEEERGDTADEGSQVESGESVDETTPSGPPVEPQAVPPSGPPVGAPSGPPAESPSGPPVAAPAEPSPTAPVPADAPLPEQTPPEVEPESVDDWLSSAREQLPGWPDDTLLGYRENGWSIEQLVAYRDENP